MKDLTKEWLKEFESTPMWNSLNDKQQNAVSLPNKNSLILAGAGTGKTKTLVARIAALIVDGGLSPDKILSLTFTNKAAREMKERIESSLDNSNDIDKLLVGTFHSVALEIISSSPEGFGYKKHLSVIGDFEQRALVDRMFRDKGWSKDSITITKFVECIKDMDEKNKRVRIEPHTEFITLVNRYKEKGLRAKDISPKKWKNFEIFRTMYSTYEEYLHKENSLDFAELLLALKERLENDKVFFEKYSGFWSIILVDEFQDTNPLQYTILKLLTEKSGSIFAVGDDDQSIYGFRGARVQNIFDFEKECIPEQVVRLEQNYRCSRNILNAANDVIKESKKRLGKELWTESDNGDLIYVQKLKDNRKEAEFIANSIERKYKLSGVLPENIAILYRNNRSSVDIEEALMKKNIPYRVVGGLSFLDKKEVKTMLAHAKCLVSMNDINALTTATSFPKIGIGKKRLDLWRNVALERGIGIEDVIEVVSHPKSHEVSVDVKALEFYEKIKEGRNSIEKLGLKLGLDNYLESIKYKDAFGDKKNYMEIVKAIDSVLSALDCYEQDGGKSLDEFVNNLLMLDTMADEESEAVWLSTIHASKGLEFEHVYLCGWEDGNLPNKRVLSEDETLIDEERRLAYVAITRAKKNLTITFKQAMVHYAEDDRDKICYIEVLTPSRYFSDIDPKSFTLSSNSIWPPKPIPVNWGKYKNHPTGDQIRMHKLDGNKSRYTEDGYLITPGSPDFIVKEESKERENKTGFMINDFVKHKRFGVGRIISMSHEDDINLATVFVDFTNMTKDFMVKYTKLEKIEQKEVNKRE
jgi:DNA helicase-2/ATP-dependent DNA helicase PcrA